MLFCLIEKNSINLLRIGFHELKNTFLLNNKVNWLLNMK